MADKVFVVNNEKLYPANPEGMETIQLYHMSIPDLEKLADMVLTPKQAVEKFNNDEISTSEYQCVYREIADDEIHVTMGKNDWQEVIINKDLQVHIHTSDEGYTVDLYAYNEDTPDEERDYDNEFLGSVYTFYADVEEARKGESED